MNKTVLLVGGIAIAVGVIMLLGRGPAETQPVAQDTSNTSVNDVAQEERVIPGVQTVLAQSDVFTYETFTQERYEELLGTESFAVFFHSKSCGTCAKKHQQIIDEAGDFTGGTILKLEFSEASADIRRELNVANYDTFVTFDREGNAQTVPGADVSDVREAIE